VHEQPQRLRLVVAEIEFPLQRGDLQRVAHQRAEAAKLDPPARPKADRNLAGIRDPDALDRVPFEARQAWRNFWPEVDALLARAQGNRP
jgi:hypothetical protein